MCQSQLWRATFISVLTQNQVNREEKVSRSILIVFNHNDIEEQLHKACLDLVLSSVTMNLVISENHRWWNKNYSEFQYWERTTFTFRFIIFHHVQYYVCLRTALWGINCPITLLYVVSNLTWVYGDVSQTSSLLCILNLSSVSKWYLNAQSYEKLYVSNTSFYTCFS